MKKLSVIMFFLSLIMIGCTENRVLLAELKESGGLVYFQSKPFTGIGFEMHNESQLSVEGTFKDGKHEGVWKYYDEDGQLKQEVTFKDGKAEGVWKYYDEDGQLSHEDTYKDGVLVRVPPGVSTERLPQHNTRLTQDDSSVVQ